MYCLPYLADIWGQQRILLSFLQFMLAWQHCRTIPPLHTAIQILHQSTLRGAIKYTRELLGRLLVTMNEQCGEYAVASAYSTPTYT
jgi:hypothetical protein